MINLTSLEESDFLGGLRIRVSGENARAEEERAKLELTGDKQDRVPFGGNIALRSFSPDRLLLVSDALAKSVALARDEHEVAQVLDLIDAARSLRLEIAIVLLILFEIVLNVYQMIRVRLPA